MKQSFGAKTLVFPTPAWLVGSYDAEGKPNAMVVAWGGVCCSHPPCLAVSLRKAVYSFDSIMKRKAFTVSIPSEVHVRETDYFGMVSGREVDKFAATGLTPVRSLLVDAPYVGEFPLVAECRLLQTVEIGGHTQFIGEILDIKVEESVCDGKGIIDLEKLRPILYAPELRSYHGVGKTLGRAFALGKGLTKTEDR
jgi:flavin reductase (DIM6/NTAB) family NADH-FMN oxidoreductase RutF